MTGNEAEAKPGDVAAAPVRRPPMIQGEDKVVKIGDVHPNPWNPNKQSDFMFEKLRAEMREFGFIDPCTVRRMVKGKGKKQKVSYQIIDGEHRWRAAGDEGMKEIPVRDLGVMTDERAEALTLIFIDLHGEPDPFLQAKLVNKLQTSFPDLTAAVLPYNDKQMDHFKSMVAFDWSNLGKDESAAGQADRAASGKPTKSLSLKLFEDQWLIVRSALDLACQLGETDSDARALEYICADYISGAVKAPPSAADKDSDTED